MVQIAVMTSAVAAGEIWLLLKKRKAEAGYKARNPTLRGFVPRAWFDFMTGSFIVCWRIYLQPEAHV